MTDIYYKVLGVDGKPCHGGTGAWKRPHGKRSGAWMPKIDDPVLCARGYHLCRRGDLVRWLGPTIYEAEVAPDAIILAADDKVVTSGPVRLVRQMTRWNDRTARLFAADCAERTLPIFERAYPGDDRPRKAIAAARAYARGEIDSAAWSAAASAAFSLERGAVAAIGEEHVAARAWQTDRLFAYLAGEVGDD
jgi:hypothetical protein